MSTQPVPNISTSGEIIISLVNTKKKYQVSLFPAAIYIVFRQEINQGPVIHGNWDEENHRVFLAIR